MNRRPLLAAAASLIAGRCSDASGESANFREAAESINKTFAPIITIALSSTATCTCKGQDALQDSRRDSIARSAFPHRGEV